MADMIMNILTAVSILVIAYVVYLMVRLNKISSPTNAGRVSEKQSADDDYSRIVANVRDIELSRQPNTGVHHDDESVYIKRGIAIKDSTSFFKLVNR